MVEYIKSSSFSEDIIIDTSITVKESLKKLKQQHYSILVLDLSLPDSIDFDFIKTIRSMEEYQETPIIVYTGKRFKKAEEEELNQLVNDIIIKAEKSPERLLDDIQMFLDSFKNNELVTDKEIFKEKTVLIVDDDIRNVFALIGLLESYNIHVEYNTSGIDALKRLEKSSKIDLILMDIMMPEMDGFETMRRIRKQKALKEIPIIALTAKTMRGDRDKCLEAGATEYLSKPLNKEKLMSVLRIWLQ